MAGPEPVSSGRLRSCLRCQHWSLLLLLQPLPLPLLLLPLQKPFAFPTSIECQQDETSVMALNLRLAGQRGGAAAFYKRLASASQIAPARSSTPKSCRAFVRVHSWPQSVCALQSIVLACAHYDGRQRERAKSSEWRRRPSSNTRRKTIDKARCARQTAFERAVLVV
jgi:hypothetical protein